MVERSSDTSKPAANDASSGASVAPKLLARVPLHVRWRDLDAFNHVNNAMFLGYLEEARLVWMDRIDGIWASDNGKPVLAATHVNYRRQLQWPNAIAVELYAERIGNSSLTIAHRIVAADDAALLYSDGHVVLVWIDAASGRSAALPAVVRQACS